MAIAREIVVSCETFGEEIWPSPRQYHQPARINARGQVVH